VGAESVCAWAPDVRAEKSQRMPSTLDIGSGAMADDGGAKQEEIELEVET